ncbi:dockerin type I repeat-containing protein [Ruminococcus sp. HUN007]|uniref:dockerin type I repeat-containing protein n=1 Tax=Ruminococcus sp. HUN007 TaxID=1514668 RepID=UPI0005D1C305|nr:dockerin type I repeat-containing protein [Ruminococcus sp. HUN007]
MKTGKTLAFATAVLTAFTPLSSAGITAYDVPAVFAEENGAAVKLPKWVPTDFKSALEFRNRYGATHIEDGYLCVLFTEQITEKDEERYSISESSFVEDGDKVTEEHGAVTTELYHHTFKYEDPDMPSHIQFETAVYKGTKAGKFCVRFCDKTLELTDCIQPKYVFNVNDKLEITETDLNAWVPDCMTEFENYKEKNGDVAVYDGRYLTFCMESNAGTPYGWTDFGHNTDGGILGNYGSFDCSPVSAVPLEGGRINTINVYFPEADGPAAVSWKLAKTFGDEEVIKTLSADCVITDGARKIILNDTAGDINLDGKTSILDAVMLQNWLIGSETSLKDAGAADLNKDGRINILDLCRIKELLLHPVLHGDPKINTPEGPDSNADHFSAEYIRTSDLDVTYPGHMIIKSQKEFEDFLNAHSTFGYSDNTKEMFAEAKKKYTDKWFADNSLFIILLEEGSGSVKHTVTNVTNDAVTIERYSPLVGTADMAYWCILVEGDKTLKFTDNTKVVINHKNESIT